MMRSRAAALLTAGMLVAGVLAALVPPAKAFASPTHSPAPRFFASMAYDAAHDQVVLFGGRSSGAPFGDTWTWDGTVWTEQHPLHSPQARSEAQMAYDAASGQMLLFGGGFGGLLDDTWTWDGTDWTQQHPAHSPSGRVDGMMAYDAALGRVVLFGGVDDNDLRNDTWTWDGTDWTQQHPAHAPPVRRNAGLAYDSADRNVVLFGGDSYSSVSMNDTWTWDGTDWTQQHPAHRPGARDDLGMADDAAAGTVVLFGGRGSCRPCGDFGIRGDTRTWDGTDWTLVRKAHIPPPREGHSIAYDSARGTVVMFGGRDIYHFYSDTWTWDGSRWTNHPAASISLRPRSGSPGTSIHIKGHGFTAFKSVEITFVDSTLGVVFLKEFFADTNGTFSGRVRIPSNASPGRQYIQARGRPRRVQKAKRGFTVT